MSLQIVRDVKNNLLGRREIEAVFKLASGHLTRSNALDAISNELKVKRDDVYLWKLEGQSGSRDLKGTFYCYSDPANAHRQLPKYVLVRMNPALKERKEAQKPSMEKRTAGKETAQKGQSKPPEKKPSKEQPAQPAK